MKSPKLLYVILRNRWCDVPKKGGFVIGTEVQTVGEQTVRTGFSTKNVPVLLVLLLNNVAAFVCKRGPLSKSASSWDQIT